MRQSLKQTTLAARGNARMELPEVGCREKASKELIVEIRHPIVI